jgi:hypothetical protein
VSEWSVQQALICATWCGCARQHCIYPPAPPKSPEYPQAPSQWQVARSCRFVACLLFVGFSAAASVLKVTLFGVW